MRHRQRKLGEGAGAWRRSRRQGGAQRGAVKGSGGWCVRRSWEAAAGPRCSGSGNEARPGKSLASSGRLPLCRGSDETLLAAASVGDGGGASRLDLGLHGLDLGLLRSDLGLVG
jgi:hypothetical protein